LSLKQVMPLWVAGFNQLKFHFRRHFFICFSRKRALAIVS